MNRQPAAECDTGAMCAQIIRVFNCSISSPVFVVQRASIALPDVSIVKANLGVSNYCKSLG